MKGGMGGWHEDDLESFEEELERRKLSPEGIAETNRHLVERQAHFRRAADVANASSTSILRPTTLSFTSAISSNDPCAKSFSVFAVEPLRRPVVSGDWRSADIGLESVNVIMPSR